MRPGGPEMGEFKKKLLAALRRFCMLSGIGWSNKAERAAAEQVPWRKIDTAPRDGTVIWLRFGDDGVSPGKFRKGKEKYLWKFVDTKNQYEWFVNYSVDGPGGPSHWLPINEYAGPTVRAPAMLVDILQHREADGGVKP